MQKQDRLTPARVLVLGFAALILTGAFLLTLPISSHEGISFIDALFTATSAVCVTGLVVMDTGTYFTLFGQLVILGLIQVGGLGFMTAGTIIFILLGKRITLKERLFIQEALNQFNLAGLVRLTKNIIIFTLVLEAVGAMLLSISFIPRFGLGKGIYYSIFHAISAFCNAGFDLMGNFTSLTGFTGDYLVMGTIFFLFFVGGLGFTVLVDLHEKRKIKHLSLHSKIVLVMSFLLLLVGTLLVMVLEFNNPDTLGPLAGPQKVANAFFTSATPRTAGFNVLPTDLLQDTTLYFLIALMFIGASPASTGGGIKTTTFSAILIAVYSIIKGHQEIFIFHRRLPFTIINKSLAIIVVSMLLVFTISILLTITEQADFLSVLFETVSAFGTVGLSAGATTELSQAGRVLIIFTMFSGRVGPLTLALALAQRLKKKPLYRYPEERILVG